MDQVPGLHDSVENFDAADSESESDSDSESESEKEFNGESDSESVSHRRRRRRRESGAESDGDGEASGYEDNEEDASEAGSSLGKRRRVYAAPSKSEDLEQRRQRWDEYYRGSFYGNPSAHTAYTLAQKLNKASNDSLWLAIVGATNSYVREQISQHHYIDLCVEFNG